MKIPYATRIGTTAIAALVLGGPVYAADHGGGGGGGGAAPLDCKSGWVHDPDKQYCVPIPEGDG